LRLSLRHHALLAIAALTTVVAIGALFAPYIYAEYSFNLQGQAPTLQSKPDVPIFGRWFDDYFIVETIDPNTFAIGEPRYYQGNYSYLILGERRAVLFDAGSGLRNMVPAVRSLTSLPVTAIASHLHFDHVGALGRLDKTAMLDNPSLRARARDSRLRLARYEFMGFADRLATPTFHVDEWWTPDSMIDLGGRRLRVLATPGHTSTSVSLYDGSRHQLFVGDFIYPGNLYAFLPDASRSAYHDTTKNLLSIIDPATKIFTAHMANPPEPVKAPVLETVHLQALQRALMLIEQDRLTSTGLYPKSFPVRGELKFVTGWDWNNR
jgi:hydroxyacylglutathione hydrolase